MISPHLIISDPLRATSLLSLDGWRLILIHPTYFLLLWRTVMGQSFFSFSFRWNDKKLHLIRYKKRKFWKCAIVSDKKITLLISRVLSFLGPISVRNEETTSSSLQKYTFHWLNTPIKILDKIQTHALSSSQLFFAVIGVLWMVELGLLLARNYMMAIRWFDHRHVFWIIVQVFERFTLKLRFFLFLGVAHYFSKYHE